MAVVFRILAPFSIALLTPASATLAQEALSSSEFTKCADSGSHPSLEDTECARVQAPLDHTDGITGTIELFVRKFPAEGNPEGQLWLVAGGPGESGASFYPFMHSLRAAAPGFDVLVPDHRGTGFSTRLCPREEDPSGEAGSALAGEEWGTCFNALSEEAGRTKAFTISNAAHDLDLLITRFDTGGPTFLYGVSYGTQLALRMLTLEAQDDLDGVILDSLVPLESNGDLDLSHRSAVTDSVGRTVLRKCDERPDCRRYFRAGAEQALRRIFERDDVDELAGANLRYKLAALLDFPETRVMLPDVIAGLQAGDPAWLEYAMGRLASIGASLQQYPQSGSSIPLVSLISRSENNARPTLTTEMVESEEENNLFASPLPSLLLSGGIPTYEPDASFGKSPEKLPRTIVLHGTLDPKTPYHGAEEHVAALKTAGDIKLIPVEQAPHFILMTAPEAFATAVGAFLEGDSVTPESGKR